MAKEVGLPRWLESAGREILAPQRRGIARGCEEERVRLVELLVEERAAVLREFPEKVPHGVALFRRLHGVAGDPEEAAG